MHTYACLLLPSRAVGGELIGLVLGHYRPSYAPVVVPGKRHRRLKKHHTAGSIPVFKK